MGALIAMDGIHDLGGMHGFGLVEVEEDEPVFHEAWEGRVLGLAFAAPTGGNVDRFRHTIERLPPRTYLSVGYYGRWLHAVETLLVDQGLLAQEEIAARLAALVAAEAPAPVAPAPQPPTPAGGSPPGARREVAHEPRFAVGAGVITREFPIHPSGHTRLPRYARGRKGTIVDVYDAYVFPDTNAHGLGESPQHVYCVGFSGRELWGDEAEPGTTVHLDLFELYLEHSR